MTNIRKAYLLLKFLRGFQIRIGLPFSWCLWIAKRVFPLSKGEIYEGRQMIEIPTGFRELNKSEYLQDGDMRFSFLAANWVPVSKTKNDKNRIKYNPDSRSARHERPIIRLKGPEMKIEGGWARGSK